VFITGRRQSELDKAKVEIDKERLQPYRATSPISMILIGYIEP